MKVIRIVILLLSNWYFKFLYLPPRRSSRFYLPFSVIGFQRLQKDKFIFSVICTT